MPYFRLVLADSKNPPKGKFKEILGNYDPRGKTRAVSGDRVLYWISKGAQISDTAHNFLIKNGVITGKKVAKHNKKIAKEEGQEAPKAETTQQ